MTTHAIIDTVRRAVGRRHRITRDEMRNILIALQMQGVVNLADGCWGGARPTKSVAENAAAWVDMCQGITVISVLPATGRYPGEVRFDEPGSMDPTLYAALMFAPSSLCARRSSLDNLRNHSKRLLIVA